MGEKWINIIQTSDKTLIPQIKAIFDSESIPYRTVGEHSLNSIGFSILGPVAFEIPEGQEARARELMEDFISEDVADAFPDEDSEEEAN